MNIVKFLVVTVAFFYLSANAEQEIIAVEVDEQVDYDYIAKFINNHVQNRIDEAKKEFLRSEFKKEHQETIDLDKGYSKKHPLIIDLANTNTLNSVSDHSGAFYIKVINMVPRQRDQYSFSVDTKKIAPLPFHRIATTGDQVETLSFGESPGDVPNMVTMSALEKMLAIEVPKKIENHCTPFQDLVESVRLSNSEAKVDQYVSQLRALTAEGLYAVCPNFTNIMESIELTTTQLVKFKVKRNNEYTISISKKGSEDRLIKVRGLSKQWMSHFGFTFVENRNDSYFSKEGLASGEPPATTYTIEKQQDSDDFLYSATALFTYPYATSGDWKFGVTTGLGANNESIFIYLGPSVVIHDNFLFTMGVVIQEFDVLKGVYDEGQDIGTTPIDSQNLVDSTYKPSFGFTFGYKFSE